MQFKVDTRLVLSIVCTLISASFQEQEQKALVISYDGFRYDYIEKLNSYGVGKNAFEIIASKGYRPQYSEAVMPTKTFVNHFTLATGCYADHHTIVDNKFYDPVLSEVFSGAKQDESKWFVDDKCEPLWNTVSRHDKKAGVVYWFGSGSITSKNKNVESYGSFSMDGNLRRRFKAALDWLKNGDKSLAMVYFHQPDLSSHMYGVDSADFISKLKYLNEETLWLLDEVKNKGLSETLNILMVSDHGMSNIPSGNTINLDDYVPTSAYRTQSLHSNLFWNIWPKNGEWFLQY